MCHPSLSSLEDALLVGMIKLPFDRTESYVYDKHARWLVLIPDRCIEGCRDKDCIHIPARSKEPVQWPVTLR